VVVGAEIYGITGHVRAVCERLADLGYVALAPDVHHRAAPWVELAEDELWIRRHDEYGAPDDAEGVATDVGAGL
jgi:carboxymethylenebutenolidase